MIRSMTAYCALQLTGPPGRLNIEIRSVNSRYLDLYLRLPDSLRFTEPAVREIASQYVRRGKIELRIGYSLQDNTRLPPLDEAALQRMAADLALARRYMPEVSAPRFAELPRLELDDSSPDQAGWLDLCQQACHQAMQELDDVRLREGSRLAQAMHGMAQDIRTTLGAIQDQLPDMMQAQQKQISERLREALLSASPEGLSAISGAELSARIAQEASLFGLRVDIAEEITRLNAHLEELDDILQGAIETKNQTFGKRLDFIFQEMNREANTLGSKAASVAITQAAIELKLSIEQLREQAQNIE